MRGAKTASHRGPARRWLLLPGQGQADAVVSKPGDRADSQHTLAVASTVLAPLQTLRGRAFPRARGSLRKLWPSTPHKERSGAPPLRVRPEETRAATGSRRLVPHRIAACGGLPGLPASPFARDSGALREAGPGDWRASPCSGPAPARGGYVQAGQLPLARPHPSQP